MLILFVEVVSGLVGRFLKSCRFLCRGFLEEFRSGYGRLFYVLDSSDCFFISSIRRKVFGVIGTF